MEISSAVLEYVNAKLHDPRAWDDVRFTFGKAVDARADAVLFGFERLAVSPEIDAETRAKLLGLFGDRQVPFHHGKELFGVVLAHQIPDSAVPIAMDLLRRMPYHLRLVTVAEQMTPLDPYSLDDQTLQREQRVVEDAKSLLPERTVVFEILGKLLNSTGVAWNQLEALRQDLHSVQDDDKANDESFKELPSDLWAGGPIYLQGYVVAEHGPHQYEIAMAGNPNQHAILFTSSTAFQSKGYFSLQVEPSTVEIPVQLKEEIGGFTQNWKVYSECDVDCRNGREEARARWAELRKKGDELLRRKGDDYKKMETAAKAYPEFPTAFNAEACAQLVPCEYVQPGFYAQSGELLEYLPMRWSENSPLNDETFPMSDFVEVGSGRTLMLYGEQDGPYASELLIVPYVKKGQGSEMWSLNENIAPRIALKDFFRIEKVGIVRGKPLFKLTPALGSSGYVEARTVTNDISLDSPQPRSLLLHLPGKSRVTNTLGVHENGAFSGEKLADLQTKLSHNWGEVLAISDVQACAKKVFHSDFDHFMDAINGPGGAHAENGTLEISACKAHMCPDESAIIEIDLNDLTSAGAIQTDSSIVVYMGDYDGPSSLPQGIRDWLKNDQNKDKDIEYQK